MDQVSECRRSPCWAFPPWDEAVDTPWPGVAAPPVVAAAAASSAGPVGPAELAGPVVQIGPVGPVEPGVSADR